MQPICGPKQQQSVETLIERWQNVRPRWEANPRIKAMSEMIKGKGRAIIASPPPPRTFSAIIFPCVSKWRPTVVNAGFIIGHPFVKRIERRSAKKIKFLRPLVSGAKTIGNNRRKRKWPAKLETFAIAKKVTS